jgi:hypothetical protein
VGFCTIITRINIKINIIFRISVKNYVEPVTFEQKILFVKNRPVGDHRVIFRKKTGEGYHRSIFHKKNFLFKSNWFDVVFYADSEYDIYFAINSSYNGAKEQIATILSFDVSFLTLPDIR